MAIAALFALFMSSAVGERNTEELAFFEFIPAEMVHWTGIVAEPAMRPDGAGRAAGVVTMVRRIARRDGVSVKSLVDGRPAWTRTGRALWFSLGIESLGQSRYRRQDCTDDAPVEPWYRRRWFIHAMTIWGFLGLMVGHCP